MTKIESCLLCKNYNTHPCECEHCEDWNNFRISESGKALREEIYSDGYEKGKNERLPRYVDIAPLDILDLSGRSEEFVEGVKWILELVDKNERPHGKWIESDKLREGCYICSHCKEISNKIFIKSPFF